MRTKSAAAAILLALAAAGCRDKKAPPPAQQAPPAQAPAGRLQLALQLADSAAWNQEDTMVVTLANGSAAPVDDALVQLFVQAPVAVVADSAAATKPKVETNAAGTRLTFAVGAVAPGRSVEIRQAFRTPPAPAKPAPPVPGAPPAPKPRTPPSPADTLTRFVVRARLLRARDSLELAAPAEDTLHIRPGSEVAVGGCTTAADVSVTRYGIGPVRVGMTMAALRSACPEARDTAWKGEEGTQEAGAVVMPGGRRVVAVAAGDRVGRLMVDQPGLKTAAGFGVGSPVGELRATYGRMCAGTTEKRFAVWFPNAPGVSFALDSAATRVWAPTRAHPDSIPDETRIGALWVRPGNDDCPPPAAAP